MTRVGLLTLSGAVVQSWKSFQASIREYPIDSTYLSGDPVSASKGHPNRVRSILLRGESIPPSTTGAFSLRIKTKAPPFS